MAQTCPKCGSAAVEADTCARCKVVVSKYEAYLERLRTEAVAPQSIRRSQSILRNVWNRLRPEVSWQDDKPLVVLLIFLIVFIPGAALNWGIVTDPPLLLEPDQLEQWRQDHL